ncbi:hypothetical protein Bbelb_123370 [Branchiostoma belcheri]|nr:hypothetical protein Bbelb_123370 [Branchiostoma belcheri]
MPPNRIVRSNLAVTVGQPLGGVDRPIPTYALTCCTFTTSPLVFTATIGMRRRAGRDTLLVKRLGWFLRDGRRGRGRADRLDLCKMCCKPERTGTLFRQRRTHLHITMAVLLLVSVIRYGLVEAAAAPSVQTPVVDVVHGNVGEDVTLPVRVRTDHQVFAQTWNKLYGGVHSMREAVYMDSPSTGTAMSLGSLKGRASLGPDGSLRIHRAGPDDEGMYVLSVLMDVVGQKEHYVTLQMHAVDRLAATEFTSQPPPSSRRYRDSKCSIAFLGPLSIKVPVDFSEASPLHAMQNSLVTLNCTVRHSSVLLQDVQWKKDGSQLWERRTANQQHHGNGQWMDVMTYTESDDVLTSVLTFQAVKREDSGNYTCHAHHRGGIVVASLFLEVFYSAKIINISESPQLVLENANVTLDCVAEGNPPPILSWHKDGDYSSLKSTFSDAGWHRERVGRLNLTLLRFREGDSGVYTCEATNGVPSGRKDNKSVLVAMMQVKAITAPGPETEAENAIIVERDPSTPNDVYQQGGEVDNDFYSTLVTVGIVTVTALSLLLLLAVGFLLCRRKKAAGTKILKTNIRRDVVRHRHLGQSREVEVYRPQCITLQMRTWNCELAYTAGPNPAETTSTQSRDAVPIVPGATPRRQTDLSPIPQPSGDGYSTLLSL